MGQAELIEFVTQKESSPTFVGKRDSSILAVVDLAIPPWMLNMFQIAEVDTGREFVREEWSLPLPAAIGAVIGVTALTAFSAGPLVPFVIGLVLLGSSLFTSSRTKTVRFSRGRSHRSTRLESIVRSPYSTNGSSTRLSDSAVRLSVSSTTDYRR